MISAAQIPNLITAARIASTPVLLLLALTDQRAPYAWLLAAALASDIADGYLARRWQVVSELGSLLDSVADLLVFVAAAVGVGVFHPQVVQEHAGAFALVVGLWLGVSAAGYLRYGRMASFHTLLARVSAYAMGIFLGVLFLWGFEPWLFWSAVAVAVASQAEEIALLAVLPRWTPNVGSLRRVLAARGADARAAGRAPPQVPPAAAGGTQAGPRTPTT